MPPFCTKCGWHHLGRERHRKTNWQALADYWKNAYAELAQRILKGE